MEPYDTPKRRPPPKKAEPAPLPTEGELSRIAREAVRQPPDPRLDKQLERMGLGDASQPAEPAPGQLTAGAGAMGPELERLGKELWRIQVTLWALVTVVAILAVLVLVLLFR